MVLVVVGVVFVSTRIVVVINGHASSLSSPTLLHIPAE